MNNRVFVQEGARLFGRVDIGVNTIVEHDVVVGKLNSQNEQRFRAAVASGGEVQYESFVSENTRIGKDCIIGQGVIIFEGACLGNEVEIEERCRIGAGAIVGNRTRIMYQALIYNRVSIGANCNISGFLCNETVVEDDCSFFGRTVHIYKRRIPPGENATQDELEAPVVCKGSIVGFGAILTRIIHDAA